MKCNSDQEMQLEAEFKPFKNQKGHRRLTVFRLDALAGSLLTHLRRYHTCMGLSPLFSTFSKVFAEP